MKNTLTNRKQHAHSVFLRLVKILMVGLLLCMQLACATTGIAPYEANYTSKLRGIKVNGTRKFEKTGETTYTVSWKAKALFMRLEEKSEFEIVDGKYVKPLSYRYTRKGLGTDRPIHIEFDWENQLLKTSKGKEKKEFPLHDNVLDKLSYQIQMQLDLLRDPSITEFTYEVANHNRIKTYEFNYEKSEAIKTKVGTVDTLVFSRQKDDGNIMLWLSPTQEYLPVLIKQAEKNKKVSVKIKSWTSKGQKNTTASLSSPPADDNNPFGEEGFNDDFGDDTDQQEI